MQSGQPPLQVLCMTDGEDNCSPNYLRSLAGLINEIKEIVGPATGRKLYAPISGPLSKHKTLLEETSAKVPVWMAWIATGLGGQMLLQQAVPKEVCLIDAVAAPRFREMLLLDAQDMEQGRNQRQSMQHESNKLPSLQQGTAASKARQRTAAVRCSSQLCEALDLASAQPSWGVGHRVRVRVKPGLAPKAATVMSVLPDSGTQRRYGVLFDDETQGEVEESQMVGSPDPFTAMLSIRREATGRTAWQGQSGLLARTADPDTQRLQVLSVVDRATTDLAALMGAHVQKSGRIALEAAAAVLEPSDAAAAALELKLSAAQQASKVSSFSEPSPVDATQLLLEVVHKLGPSSLKLLPEDRLLAQRLLAAGLELLMFGGSLLQESLLDQLGPFAALMEEKAARRIRREGEELEAWNMALIRPLQDLLRIFLQKGLLDSSASPEGEVVLSAKQSARSCFTVLRRFFEPSSTRSGVEDALRRAVNRFQRTASKIECRLQPQRCALEEEAHRPEDRRVSLPAL